jgi:sec-independent protein translocase protein TatB
MSLADSIFIFTLALIIFGPKKLPEMARQLGKLVGEFRRASNEFKFQIEEELRQAEQRERKDNAAPPLTEATILPPKIDTPAAAEAALPAPAPLSVSPAAGAEPRAGLSTTSNEVLPAHFGQEQEAEKPHA